MLLRESLNQQGVLAAIDQIGVTVPGRTGGLEAVVKQHDSVFTLLDALRVASIRKELASALRDTAMPPTLTPETGHPRHSLLYCSTTAQPGPYSEECPLCNRRPAVLGALFMHVVDGVDRPALVVGEPGRRTEEGNRLPSLTLLVDGAPLAAMESERFDELDGPSAVERGLFGDTTESCRRGATVKCVEYMSDRLVREPHSVIRALRIGDDDDDNDDDNDDAPRPLYHRHVGVAPFLRLRPANTDEEEATLAEYVVRAFASGRVSDTLLISCATPDGESSEHSAARAFASTVARTRSYGGDLVASTIFCAPSPGASWLQVGSEELAAPPVADTLEVRHRLAAACSRRATGIAVAAEVAAMLLFWGPTSTTVAMGVSTNADAAVADAGSCDDNENSEDNEDNDDNECGTQGRSSSIGEGAYPVDEMNEVVGAMTLRDEATRAASAIATAPVAKRAPVEPSIVSLSLSSSSSSSHSADNHVSASVPWTEECMGKIRAFAPAVGRVRTTASNAIWAAQALVRPEPLGDSTHNADERFSRTARRLYVSMFNGLAHALGLIKEPTANPPAPARMQRPRRQRADTVEKEAGMLLAEQLASDPDSTCAPEGRVLLIFAGPNKATSWAPPWRPCAASITGYVYILCRRPGATPRAWTFGAGDDRALRIYRRLDVCTFVVENGSTEIGLQCHHASWRVATQPDRWLKQSTVARQLRDVTRPRVASQPSSFEEDVPLPPPAPAQAAEAVAVSQEPSSDWVAAIVRQTLAQAAALPEAIDAEGAEWLKRTTESIDAAHHIMANVMDPKRRRVASSASQRV